MLTFGNTFVNFGGTYVTGWDSIFHPSYLPPYTIRAQFKEGYNASSIGDGSGKLVSPEHNIWDIDLSHPNEHYPEWLYEWGWLFNNNTDLLSIIGANTKTVSAFNRTFYGCTALTSVNMFDVSDGVIFDQMFYGCKSLLTVPDFYTPKATSLTSMFRGCTKLKNINLYDISNVKDMRYTFGGCDELENVNLGYDCKVIDARTTFQYCESLKSAPLFDTSNASSTWSMFQGCSSLTSIPNYDLTNTLDVGNMFINCYNVNDGILSTYQQLSGKPVTVTSHDNAFRNCGVSSQTGSSELAQIPTSWGGTKAE